MPMNLPDIPHSLPHDASLHGHRVDAVLRYLTVSTALCFAVMAAVLLVAVLFHRGRARQALYTHGDRARDRLAAMLAGVAMLFGIDAVAVVRSAIWAANRVLELPRRRSAGRCASRSRPSSGPGPSGTLAPTGDSTPPTTSSR